MSHSLHVFTCAAMNYLPKVRILCESVRAHHPEACIHLALADERPDWLDIANEPFDSVLPISSLMIPDWRAWSFRHSIVELATAIKPFALRHLLDRPGCRKVLYFDPDMVLFSRVDDILAALDMANLALTPHQTKPEASIEAILDNELASMKHGVFNLGFIGVSNTDEGRRFLDWWSNRLYHFCRADTARGLFTDQKWIDFAPVFFDGVQILKSSRHNVATWNLTTRHLSGNFENGFSVDGEPLGFYHFTGFDSGAHRVMAHKNAVGSPAVADLIDWYEKRIEVAESDPISQWPWAFGRFEDGSPIGRHHRWLYREHRDLQQAFPDPYRSGSGTLQEWTETEGRLRYPELVNHPARVLDASPVAQPVSPRRALRLAMEMARPRRGAALRARLTEIVRREGMGSLLTRIRR